LGSEKSVLKSLPSKAQLLIELFTKKSCYRQFRWADRRGAG
jgi:hypothetical protein